MITKKNILKVYFLFIFSHLLLWTIVPSLTNENLPLDTIEALAWGSDLSWGFNKHPPLSAFAVEFFFKLFGNQDWAYYLLSQIFVLVAFLAIFNLARDFFDDIFLAFFSILLLEGLFFLNFTTPEFNVNVSQLPFWALSVFFSWRCIKYNKFQDYIFLGLFAGLGILSKYLFLYLVLSIKLLFLYLIIKKKIKSYHIVTSGMITLAVLLPHILWLFENDFATLKYGLQRTGGLGSYADHFVFPLTLIFKQLTILIPVFLMAFFLMKKFKFKKIIFDEKMIFLMFTFALPVLLMVLTSFIMGVKIRTMWMTPFYLLIGIFLIQLIKSNINFKNLRKFYSIFLFFFLLSPSIYLIVSIASETKRTDYPGKEIARLVQNKWDDNFRNEIKVVIGDEWFAGNLSYHLYSRPKWMIELNNTKQLNSSDGVIYTGNPKVLKKICPGVFGTIKPVGYCMIGKK